MGWTSLELTDGCLAPWDFCLIEEREPWLANLCQGMLVTIWERWTVCLKATQDILKWWGSGVAEAEALIPHQVRGRKMESSNGRVVWGFPYCSTTMAHTSGQPSLASKTQGRADGSTAYPSQLNHHCGGQRAGRAVGGELARNKIPNKATRFAWLFVKQILWVFAGFIMTMLGSMVCACSPC